ANNIPLGGYREWCSAKLKGLLHRHRVAFAASCAERQFGTYTYVSRLDGRLKPDVIRRAIDSGWTFASGNSMDMNCVATLGNEVESLVPDLDDDPPPYGSLILDASAATAYLLRVCLSDQLVDAVWAGECARNAVDEWLMRKMFSATVEGEPTLY